MRDESFLEIVTDSWNALELPAVLEDVAAHALSAPGAEKVLAAVPEENAERVKEQLSLVGELREITTVRGPLGLGDLVPMEALLAKLDHTAAVLDTDEILAVADLVTICGTVRHRLESLGERFFHLRRRAGRIHPLEGLKSQIGRVLDEQGMLRSTASPRLMDIHRRMSAVRDRIRRRLERIVQDRELSRIVQEDYITLRSDRYVVLLRPEFKGLLDGIVHDHSRSGASVYVEPLGVVELNNDVASLSDEERDEIRRIFKELTDQIRVVREELFHNYEVLADLDAFQARALYAVTNSCVNPELVEEGFRILGARHPLLLAAAEVKVVPMDVVQEPATIATVISGANMGGKTVALKISGLFPLMVRCGIWVPASEGSRIAPFVGIMADIGDDQDIRSRVSSFSGHMLRIKAIIDSARPGDLVLLDELGGATDPEEGSALAMAIIDELVNRQARVVVTTHLTHLKAYALSRPDVKNVSAEFHPVTLKPTFRLLYDLPGESHAIETAESIGLDPKVVEAARHYLDKAAGGSTRLLQNLREKITEVDGLRKDLEERRQILNAELEEVRARREELVDEFRKEARDMIRSAEKQITDLQKSLKSGAMKKGGEPRSALERVRAEIASHLGTPLEKRANIDVGARVKVKTLGREGTVTAVHDRGKLDITVGNLTLRAESDDVVVLGWSPREKSSSKKERIAVEIPFATPQWEVNVIGLRVHEALPIVEKALDKAVLGGLSSISIIHGKGTGRLKQGIREHLTGHSLVRGIRSGDIQAGGEGVTVIDLVTE
jgi:DNA mismatch repair protein MutS2